VSHPGEQALNRKLLRSDGLRAFLSQQKRKFGLIRKSRVTLAA